MAVLPTYVSPQAPDTIAKLGIEAGDHAQSWMTQAANRDQIRANTQETEQRTNQMRAMLPVLVAKGNADIASAQNDITAAANMQSLRAGWQELKPKVIDDMAAIEDPVNQPATEDGTPDWEDKYHQYESLQAKYGQLNLFPEGKQYYAMLEERKKNAFDMAVRHNQAQAALDRTRTMVDSRTAIAEDTNSTRRAVADTAAGARVTSAETSAGARTTAASTAATAGIDRTAIHEFSKAADDYENAALKEEDPDKSAALMAKANQFRAKGQKMIDGAQPGQPSPEVKLPAAPQRPPAEASDKLYIVDPKTNRAELDPAKVKTPKQTLAAYQQMVDDKVIDAATARAELTKLGFKPKH